MMYPLAAESFVDAKEELLHKVKQGIIPPGNYRLIDMLSLKDTRSHWWAKKL